MSVRLRIVGGKPIAMAVVLLVGTLALQLRA